MNNCIDIRVWNLSPESVNRLGGATSASLDINDLETIRLTKSVESLSSTNKLQTAGVLPFSVPSTPKNDAIFIAYFTPLTVDNRKEYYDVAVNISGHPLEFNRLVVTNTPKKGGDEWGLELRRSPDHWIELSQDYNINEIDYGTFDMSKENIVANWENSLYNGEAGQVPYHFPLADYGGWCDRTTPIPDAIITNVKTLAVEDFRPYISLNYLLKQGFCNIGWSIEGVIFDSDWFNSQWVYALSKTYYEAGVGSVVNVLSTLDLDNTAAQLIRFDILDTGSGQQVESGTGIGVSYYGGLKNILNIEYQYKIDFICDIQNTGGATSQTFNIIEISEQFDGLPTGEVLSSDVVVSILSSETKRVYLEFVFVLKPGQCAAIHAPEVFSNTNLTLLKGIRVTASPFDKSLFTGQTVNIKDAVRDDLSLMTAFKMVCHLCRLSSVTDFVTKTVTLYPKKRADVYGFVLPGFMREEEANVDISELIVEGSVELKAIRPDQLRYTEIKFKDSTDDYINSLQLADQPHSRKILNGLTLKDGITTYENIVLEPTVEAQTKGLRGGFYEVYNPPFLPHLWDNSNGERSYDIAPRILFSFGLVKQKNPAPTNVLLEYTGFFFDVIPNIEDANLTQEFGYATQLRTWEVEPTPAIDGNVVFGTQQEDLFTNFYLSITQELRGGFDIDALMLMQMKDYAAIDFRSIYRFIYRGRPISAVMTKIRDAALCAGLPTPVTFFVDPVETECCDLPCGCQFSTCEYYQDLGQFIRQGTLDDLTISYFTVDGINVIGSTPVPLGILKIVNINGRPFITNLVDALNSVGAPYMSFSYGTRISAAKGARFFTVKRPRCTPFEIIISFGVDEVYHYSDTVQEEQWFAGSWGPLGYGVESYTVPENCVITTEY
jgi:hypothetical protein